MSNVTRMPNVSQQSWPPSGDCGCDGGGWGGSGGGWWMLQNCWNQLNSFTQFLLSLLSQSVVSTQGVTDGSEAAPGKVGEIITASGNTIVNAVTGATYTVINTMSLSPGDWGIYANYFIYSTNVVGATAAWLVLLPTSIPLASTDGTPPGQGVAWQGIGGPTATSNEGGTVGPVRTISAAADPVDLRANLQATSGQFNVYWSVTARRIR
jgi:hypothetical protein